MQGVMQPGVVVIGDAYQTPCPSTGLGFTKVFTDVDVLSDCIPEWLSTPGIGTDKIARYYNDTRKISIDDFALKNATFRRNMIVDKSSVRWQLHRIKMQLPMKLGRRWRVWSEA
jgi:2-polyprenyl-6-methoxyphenol hydroxylase-like FAD-dependent oxidoreductase